MRFANPQLLHLLWCLPVIALGLHLLFDYRQSVAARFVQAHLLDDKTREQSLKKARIKAILLMAAYSLAVLALARPQWGYQLQNVKRQGLDIMVAVDVSKSMLTQDVKPSRLERTKLALKDLTKSLKGDRIGLIAFAGQAFVMCPLTTDYSGFNLSLDDLSIDSIPRGGTDLSYAIDEAIKGYGDGSQSYKTVVLITDGEEGQGDALNTARKAKDKGIKVFTVGVGTKEGELIQVPDEAGQMGFLKDASGNFVKSRLNENLLQQIAYTTGASYVRAGGAQFGLDYLYEQQLAKLEKRDIEEKQERRYNERFQWPLTLALICLLLDALLIVRIK